MSVTDSQCVSVTHYRLLLCQSALGRDQHERHPVRMFADPIKIVLQHRDLLLREIQMLHRFRSHLQNFFLVRPEWRQLRKESGTRRCGAVRCVAVRRRGARRTRLKRLCGTGRAGRAGMEAVAVCEWACARGGFTSVNTDTSRTEFSSNQSFQTAAPLLEPGT